MFKIIFLDIDGVLKTKLDDSHEFNQSACNNLVYILEKTGAKLVISSSWRHYLGKLQTAFLENGLDWDMYVIGVTPSRTGKGRTGEIMQWLKWNYPVYPNCKWIAIDDEYYDMKDIAFMGKLLKTDFDKGLTRLQAEAAIKVLNTPN